MQCMWALQFGTSWDCTSGTAATCHGEEHRVLPWSPHQAALQCITCRNATGPLCLCQPSKLTHLEPRASLVPLHLERHDMDALGAGRRHFLVVLEPHAHTIADALPLTARRRCKVHKGAAPACHAANSLPVGTWCVHELRARARPLQPRGCDVHKACSVHTQYSMHCRALVLTGRAVYGMATGRHSMLTRPAA